MNRGKVLNITKLKFVNYILENKVLLIALFVFLLGVILGVTVFIDHDYISEFTERYLNEFINLRLDGTFLKVFVNSLFDYLLVLVIFFVFGTSIFGVATTPIVLWACGAFYGSITSYLYSEYSLKGIAFNAVIFIPSNIIFSVLLLFVCKETVNFSLNLSTITFGSSTTFNLPNRFKRFLILFSLFFGVCIISALLDAVISIGFIKYFTF